MANTELLQPESLEDALGGSVFKIHSGLIALRQNQGASLSCLLLGSKGQVCFLNAGHPGVLMADSQVTYLSAPSPKPGSTESTTSWRGHSFINSGQKVTYVAFTDGIHPVDLGVSQWVKQLKNYLEKDKKDQNNFSRGRF